MTLSTLNQQCNASSEVVLEVIFNATSRSTATVVQGGGMRVSVVVPSNGTVADSFRFRQGDPISNLTACLSRSLCYGLEIVNAWKGYYQVLFDGQPVTGASAIQFPLFVTSDEAAGDDYGDFTFEPFESNLTFVELVLGGGGSTACVPECQSENETLHEVITYGGNYGDGALGWRIQNGQGRSLMGCQDDEASASSGGRCGTVNGVRVARACLPRSEECRKFVMGHPHQVLSDGSEAAGVSTGDHNQSDNGWLGHYYPSYQVSLDGNVVAKGSSGTFVSAEIDGGGGGDCSECSPNETLLEIFQYLTTPLQYTLRDVKSDQVLAQPSSSFGNSSLNEVLRYDRWCVPSSQCYDLAFDRANSSSSPVLDISDGVSTKVVLSGAHFANTVVRELPFQLILGETCDRRDACRQNESLVRVDISTRGCPQNDSQLIPSHFFAWSLFDVNQPPPSPVPEVSTTYFSNGYSGGGRYIHYQCVPCSEIQLSEATTSTSAFPGRVSFGVLNGVSNDNVAWSLERNGVTLGCRERHPNLVGGGSLNDLILTPLDGSCLTTSSDTSIPPGCTKPTGVVAGLVVGMVALVGLLATAVFYAGFGGDEAEWNNSGGNANAGGRRRRSSTRSTGTVGEDESVQSDEEEGGSTNNGTQQPQVPVQFVGVEAVVTYT